MNRKGFTLVELLVVIGIIAVLISILLPSLNKARQAAQAITCASNLRQLGTSMAFYLQDHKGALPPGRWGAPTYPASTGNGLRWYIYTAVVYYPGQFTPQMSNPATNEPRFALRVRKNNAAANIFTCPTDDAAKEYVLAGGNDIDQGGQGMSYFANAHMFPISRTIKMSTIRNSAEVLLMSEKNGAAFVGDGFGGNISQPQMGGGRHPRVTTSANDLIQYGRHGSGPNRSYQRNHNVLFADFHVNQVEYKQVWSGLSSDYTRPTGKYANFWNMP